MLKQDAPDVILLDHHWPEVRIEKVLKDVLLRTPTTRVVLYTGKSLDPSTILECARYGVAEYLAKGSISGDVLVKKLALLANDDSSTIGRLSKPSGAVQQLIEETEKTVQELESERAARRRLELELGIRRGNTTREIWSQIIRFFTVTTYVCLGSVSITRMAPEGNRVVILVAFLWLGGLYVLDKSIYKLSVRVWNSRFGLKRQ